ncbi:MAG: hypothetical protein EPO13_00315 [Actinomycetota bacterium]|nr:MAG: hypothetical protein EPO13_00315 [Actinomycetota bacterium]
MDDELTGLLASGERAAFHGRPTAGVAVLRRAAELAHQSGRDSEADAAGWLLGVCLTAAGRFGAGLAVLEPLSRPVALGGERAVFGSLASSTMASVHRQLGDHVAARGHDEHAVGLAGEVAEAVFDAHLGLAADAVGLGQADVAAVELDRALAVAAGRSGWWRQRVRGHWVSAEVALLVDDPAAAARSAAEAVALAETSSAPRHVSKGLLFLGMAQLTMGDQREAAATLRRAASLAESLGTLPLAWPARAVLGALLFGASHDEAVRSLDAARGVVRRIADDLPDDLQAIWYARPDIAELMLEPV